MIITKVRRMIRTGFVSFWRNGFLTISSVFALSISLMVIGSLLFFGKLSTTFLDSVKDRVDINVYFTLDAVETDIFEIQKQIEKLPEVREVSYVSKEKSLENFREKYQDNTLILQGLDEIGYNPLPAVLTVKTKDPSQYESVARFLESEEVIVNGNKIIDEVNYGRNKIIIDRLARIIPLVEKGGTALSIILILLSVLITFNTVRIIIFSSKDEIAVMKLVGASNIFVRGPMVVNGIMAGIFSAVISIVVLGLVSYYVDVLLIRFLSAYPGDVSVLKYILFGYFVSDFARISLTLLGSGIALGAISSYLAARRYLNI